MTLQLPPGWKLWHASGPDQVNDSWVSRWNLWAIFLSLLIVGTVFRLLDWRWALVATATVALVYHENFALIILLLPLLVVIALLKVVAAPNARLWIQRAGYAFGILLALVIVTFAVNQIRRAIYPQLEVPYSIANVGEDSYALRGAWSDEESVSRPASPAPSAVTSKSSMPQEVIVTAALKRYQPSNNVQTGPGEPQWNWQPTTLSWSGPVKADQPLHLYLTGPWLTRLLKFLDVILVVVLAAGMFGALVRTRPNPSATSNNSGAGFTALSILLVLSFAICNLTAFSSAANADEFPPKTLLEDLEKRLTRAPACAPNCAATESALVQVSGGNLNVKLRVNIGADLAITLPGANNWQPRSILVDGLVVNAVARGNDGVTLLALGKGHHELTLEGPINSDDITLQFSDRPHLVRVDADDWDIFGVNGSALAANSLQLQKRQRSAQQDTLLPAVDKAFVRIYREFNFDLDWTITTTVERVAPQTGAINISVPTLPGESIVDGGVEAKDGHVAVSLGSQQSELRWHSQLKPGAKLQLSAAQIAQAVEVWRVNASPRWHVEGEGLIPVKGDGDNEVREWRPWPGETLTLNARQPIAVKGPTTTVESSALKLIPGARSSTFEAKLIITSSIGGDYQIVLHEPAALKTSTVNGSDISQSRNDDKLVLPLTPGRNEVAINWELERGAATVTRTPALTLATVGSNINLSLQIPADRWPLWVSGPRIGPAMLYWGLLAVLVGVAFVLTVITRRFALTIPLPTWHWLLLFIGMSTVNTVGSLPVLLWFFALEARRHYFQKQQLPKGDLYYLIQIGIVILSLLALIALVAVIPESLLSAPDMQVTGNGSENYFFNWYQDRSAENLPQAQVISIPLWCYRVAMLAWSLWLVFALLRWVKWGWTIFAEGGVWPQRELTKQTGANETQAKP